MAVNKKGGSVNTSLSDFDDFGLADIGRLEELYEQEPIAVRELRRRATNLHEQREAMDELIRQQPAVAKTPEYRTSLKQNRKDLAGVSNRLRINKTATRERLNTQAVNIIGRGFSETSIGSYVNENINSLEAQSGGMQLANQGWKSLAEQKSGILNQMQGLRQESMQAAGSYLQGHGVNASAALTIQDNAGKMKELANQLIPITVAMQQLKTVGHDPLSKQRELLHSGDKAAGLLSYNKLEDEMRSGKGLGALSQQDLRKKETEAAEKLVRALDALRDSAGKTKEELEALNKNAEEAAQEFEDMSEAAKMGGGGGGASKLQIGSIITSAVAQAANIVSNAIQVIGIEQPMRNVGNIAGFANIENQKYDMWTSAVAGNMTDRLNLAGWAEAENFGSVMASRANKAVIAREIGYGAGTLAAGLQGADVLASAVQGTGASKLGIKDANTVQQVAGATIAVVENAAGLIATDQDRAQKISESEAKRAGIENMMNAVKQLNHVPGYQLQQYRDYAMGLQGSAIGMGEAGAGFLNKAAGTGFMDRMIKVGVGMDEVAKMSQFGVENMGSTFDVDQVVRAKHFENQGYGSIQANMQRQAMLAVGGSQNPSQSYEKILERAVGSGLSNAKVLTMIAENTGQMAEQAYSVGAQGDLTETISKLIIGAVNKDNPNKEYAYKTAADTFKKEEQWKTNTSASLFGMINVDRMTRSLNVDSITALRMTEESSVQMNDWRQRLLKDPSQKAKIMNEALNKGMDWRENELFNADPNKFFETVLENRTMGQLERGGKGTQFNAVQAASKLKNWAGSDGARRKAVLMGEDLEALGASKDIIDAKLALARTFTIGGQDNPYAVMADIGTQWGWSEAEVAKMAAEGEQQKNVVGDNQREKIRGERNRTKAAQAAVKILGADASGAAGIGAVTASGDVAEKVFGDNPQQQFTGAAARSAADLGASATQLNSASGKLLEAANKLISTSGLPGASTTQVEKYFDRISSGFDDLKGTLDKIKDVLGSKPGERQPFDPIKPGESGRQALKTLMELFDKQKLNDGSGDPG